VQQWQEKEMVMKKRVILAGLAIIGVGLLAGFSLNWGRTKALAASGTLEARNINVGSKVGGRIVEVLVREGDHVSAGQLLVRFDDAELEAQVLQARGQLESAKANLLKLERGSRPEEIAQAKAATADGSGFRVAEQQQARSELIRAQAQLHNAEENHRRMIELFEQGIIPRSQRDDAEERVRVARAAVQTAQDGVSAAEGRLREAKAIEAKAVNGSRKEDVEFARADVTRAQGALQQAEARYIEREVKSPASAVVEVLDLRPGDLVQPNTAIAKLLEADQLYVMVYVPETKVGHVQVGQKAEIKVDSFPNETFTGVVEQIRQKAEFLPRNVQTADERVHQVIGVKLRVENAQGKLRAGTTADVTFPEAK
jgi:HlyD family secretion protein